MMQQSVPYTATALQNELSRRSGRQILLYLTDNRRRMVTARHSAGGLVEVRLQRAFLHAPDDVLSDLGDMVAGRPNDRTALRKFIRDAFESTPAAPAAPTPAPSAKTQTFNHHDLQLYAAHLNETYLNNRSRSVVDWGRRNTTKSRRSIRFGCYDPMRNKIIMNRKLDSAAIPAYFVQYILFHEMLHEVLGIGERADGKRDIHGSLFKLMESTFPDYDKARRFEREIVERLDTL